MCGEWRGERKGGEEWRMEKRGTERRGRMEGERQDGGIEGGIVGEREDGEGGGGENSHKEKISKVRPSISTINQHHVSYSCS